jgi:hypothetical protein
VVDPSSRTDPRPGLPLTVWERAVAALIGVVFAVPAVIALFVSSNQAGTAALLLVAAAFLLLGVQGTALVRLGGGSASVELDRRVSAAVQRANEVAEANPEQALGILEGAAIIEPRVGPAAGAFRALTYESGVRRALEQAVPAGGSVSTALPPADFVVEAGSGKVLVAAVFRQSRDLQMIDLAPIVGSRQLEDAAGGLVIANQPSTSSVADYVATARDQGVTIEVVRWNGPQDDAAVTQALDRLLGPSPA